MKKSPIENELPVGSYVEAYRCSPKLGDPEDGFFFPAKVTAYTYDFQDGHMIMKVRFFDWAAAQNAYPEVAFTWEDIDLIRKAVDFDSVKVGNKCPLCGKRALLMFNMAECETKNCANYKPAVEAEQKWKYFTKKDLAC